jgi:glycosyltransferase involved in cell wall biosynthesis
MKLLICTQAVDRNDPILGFFHRWIEEISKHFEHVTVVCLRKGEYSLPNNVSVYEIGRGNKLTRAFRFSVLLHKLRDQYDRVFVHMNPEYIVLAGWYWRMQGKKVVLWYMHKAVNLRLRIATYFANDILTASKESFRLQTDKVHIVGHGIDMDVFYPNPSIPRENWALSVGRLTKSKRHDRAIEIAHADGKELRIAGDGPERASVEAYSKKLGAQVQFLGGIPHAQLGNLYRKAAYFIHTSETGSLDKVVLEALACGLPVKTSDPALKFLEYENSEYVTQHHSLQQLIPKILAILS